MIEPHPANQICGYIECPQCYPPMSDGRVGPPDRRETAMSLDSAERKGVPIFSGVIRYFPAALVAAAKVSKYGNDKHNPGQPLHWARAKSSDHADCIARHLIDMDERGGYDENGIPQVAYIVWRAMALAQIWLEENEGAPRAPGAPK